MNVSESIAPMNYFERLPHGCIFEIISKTTPRDVARATVLSKEFKIVAESDAIWGKFLPSDYREIIGRSVFPPVVNTKKELYFSLCDSPILLDGGKLSFFLDKHTGKKCFMIAASELTISGNRTYFWQWKQHPNSRFPEVACLGYACWLDICGRIGTNVLSPKTCYVGYFVFKLIDMSSGLESINSTMMFVTYKSETATGEQANIVRFATCPTMRGDGWMEIELGNFSCEESSDDLVVERFIEIKRPTYLFSVLVLEGIEFRPKIIE